MTVIAAYETSDKYWIASDSMGVYDDGLIVTTGSKIIKKENYYIGYADSYRVANIVEETCGFPKKIKNIKDLRKFRDHLYTAMQSFGYTDESSYPVCLLIISPYGIFSIEGDYQICEITDGYHSCGGGSSVAMGVLYFAKALGIDNGEKTVRNAVEASVKHVSACGGECFVNFVKKIKK